MRFNSGSKTQRLAQQKKMEGLSFEGEKGQKISRKIYPPPPKLEYAQSRF